MKDLTEGMILTSQTTDAVLLISKHISGWYVRDCEYENDDYKPVGREYLLTFKEIEKDFDID